MGVRTALTMTGLSMEGLRERAILAAALRSRPRAASAVRARSGVKASDGARQLQFPSRHPGDVHAGFGAQIEHVLERDDRAVPRPTRRRRGSCPRPPRPPFRRGSRARAPSTPHRARRTNRASCRCRACRCRRRRPASIDAARGRRRAHRSRTGAPASRGGPALAQRVHVLGDDAEIFGDERQPSQAPRAPRRRARSRARAPTPLPPRSRRRRERPSSRRIRGSDRGAARRGATSPCLRRSIHQA